MSHRARLSFLFILLSICFLTKSAYADLSSTRRFSTTVPCSPFMTGIHNTQLPLISVRVNGSVTATFLVDTGTNVLAVTNKFARKMKLPYDSNNQAGYPSALSGQPIRTTTLAKVEIGKILINNQVVVVLPAGRLGGIERSIDGILGSNFFPQVALCWDFPQHKMTFYIPGGLDVQEVQSMGFSNNSMLPIAVTLNHLWTTKATIENLGKVITDAFIVDTGSSITQIAQIESYFLSLKPSQENIQEWTYDRVQTLSTALVNTITIGPASLSNFPLYYNRQIGDLAPSTLGMDILSGFRVLIDFPAKKMYLQPTSDAVPTITFKPQSVTPEQAAPPAK